MTKHVLAASQFDPSTVAALCTRAREFDEMIRQKQWKELGQVLKWRTLYSFFCAESTRTRFSFEMAARYLGMDVRGTESAGTFSSMVKGESLSHSIRTLCELGASAIVLRHSVIGSARVAAAAADSYGVPILNGGDGSGEHPTQALLDVFTIERNFNRLGNLTITCGGDLANGRTVRSLVQMLTNYEGNSFIFYSPRELAMKADILQLLDSKRIEWRIATSMEDALVGADVIYWTRAQRERFSLLQKVAQHLRDHLRRNGKYVIGKEEMDYLVGPDAILMHPLPIKDEIHPEVDNDPRAVYFEQVHYGLLMRMALLDYCLA